MEFQHINGRPAKELSNALRFLAADAVERAQSGHPGMPLGMADIATVLFADHLKFDATNPDWPDRDRFILSNGHGSMLQYALLHLCGYAGATLDELKRFRQLHARTAGHPELGHLQGIETTTGPLGQGLATAVGFALAERLMNTQFGDEMVDHRTWVFCGDGCLMEGVGQEAISFAGHLRLSKLILIFDDNGTTIDGSTDVATSEDHAARFRAANWYVLKVDGHDHAAIGNALVEAKLSDRPVVIMAQTRIGFGAPTKEGKSIVHGAPLGAEELAGLRENLSWPHDPFEVPDEIRTAWLSIGRRGETDRLAWQQRIDQTQPALKTEFERRISGELPARLSADVALAIESAVDTPQNIPIRKGSQLATGILAQSMNELVGGSADLTGSVLTKAQGMTQVVPGQFGGNHVGYGVREHVMAATLNGLALHGGLMPYGGTYLTFSDYCRPSIRLAAIMGIRVVFLFSHDSIGVGEDGPTHQPIEHLASLRAIPGLKVYRPADTVEALECWLDAVSGNGPSVMVVSRQKVTQARLIRHNDMPSRKGGYVLHETNGPRDVTLLATGSEVSTAVQIRSRLAEEGLEAAVVSLPCWRVFEQQSVSFQESVLGDAPRFAIEAGVSMGWARFVHSERNVFGVDQFGLSGPTDEVFAEMGLTADSIAPKILERLGHEKTVVA